MNDYKVISASKDGKLKNQGTYTNGQAAMNMATHLLKADFYTKVSIYITRRKKKNV